MVNIMENPIAIDDLGVKKTIFGYTHIYIYLHENHKNQPFM